MISVPYIRKNAVFRVFQVFRNRYSPLITELSEKEHQPQKHGTQGVQNTESVPVNASSTSPPALAGGGNTKGPGGNK